MEETIKELLALQPESDASILSRKVNAIIPATADDRVLIYTNEPLMVFLRDSLTSLNANPTQGSDYIDLAASLAMIVAEVAKSEDGRKSVGSTGFFAPIVEAHTTAKSLANGEKVLVQTLRALGNSCFDNEENRDSLLEIQGAVEALTANLSSRNLTVLQPACGALLNISMDNEPVQLEVLRAGGSKQYLKLMDDILANQSEMGSLASIVVRAWNNLLELETGAQELSELNGLKTVFAALSYHHAQILKPDLDEDDWMDSLEVLQGLAAILESIGERDFIQRAIVTDHYLEILLNFVDHQPETLPSVPEDEKDDDTADYVYIRKNFSRIVTLVTMNDKNMVELAEDTGVIERFKNWMTLSVKNGSIHDEDEVRMSGALCVGNLARSDSTCVTLIRKHDVGPSLATLLNLELEHVKKSEGRDDLKSSVKVLHAVVGTLKNLALAPGDRKYLGELGIIDFIASLLEIDSIKPVHLLSVGVLKNLCGSQKEMNTYRVITGREPPSTEATIASLPFDIPKDTKTPLSKLINLIWKATGDNMTGIRNEGGRAIVNLVRTSHLGKAPHFIAAIVEANGIAPLVQIVTGALLTRTKTDGEEGSSASNSEDDNHVHFGALPAESQVFPAVQNEGLIALILIANSLPASIPTITKYHSSLIPTAETILSSGLEEETAVVERESSSDEPKSEKTKYADEVKVNMCLFLGVLASSDDSFKGKLSPVVTPILKKLLTVNPDKKPIIAESPVTSPTSPEGTTGFNSSSGFGLARTNTKSAKNLNIRRLQQSNDFGNTVGSVSSLSAEEGLRVWDAANRLLQVL